MPLLLVFSRACSRCLVRCLARYFSRWTALRFSRGFLPHLTALMLGVLISSVTWAAEVIAHPGSVGTETLSVANARAIFGMRQVKWPNGNLIRVFVLPDTHPAHVATCKEKLNVYPYQLRQSWDRLVFSGMAQAPVEVASEAEMVARVSTTPGAIGYVSRIQNNEKIRVINVQ
jgi:ABC-type phosphate transport system substrate-binding protein